MLLIGEDPRKHIHQYSEEFKKNFVDLLKTTHGEKKVHINHFYQEVCYYKATCCLRHLLTLSLH